jgi:hypothetical protein
MERTVSRVRLMMANFNRGSKAAEDLLQGNDQVRARASARATEQDGRAAFALLAETLPTLK